MVVETGVPGENHRPAASHRQTLLYNAVHLRGFELTVSVVIGTDCTGSCKSKYYMITTTTSPNPFRYLRLIIGTSSFHYVYFKANH